MSENNQYDSEKVIIGGINNDGQKFRPSDWVERLASILSSFGEDQRLRYHKCAYPCTIQGVRSLVVDQRMKENIPEAYEFIMEFAKNNNLRIQYDRRKRQDPNYQGEEKRSRSEQEA